MHETMPNLGDKYRAANGAGQWLSWYLAYKAGILKILNFLHALYE